MPSEKEKSDRELRNRIIGFGDQSGRKSYYPELLSKLKELENEIAIRKETEVALEGARQLVRDIMNAMSSVIISVDKDHLVTEWNLEAKHVTGIPKAEAVNSRIEEVFPLIAPFSEKIDLVIRKQEEAFFPKQQRTVDEITIYEDFSIFPLHGKQAEGVVIRIDDVTEKVRLEEMMIQSEKMVSLGSLAAGVAHEINNPLSVVLSAAQNISRRLLPDFKKNISVAEELNLNLIDMNTYLEKRSIHSYISAIMDAADRASRIMTSMLTFSRKSAQEVSFVNVLDLLDRSVNLALQDFDLKKKFDFKSIEIIREFEEGDHPIHCVENDIEQVFFNLIKNAAHALKSKTADESPRITLRVRNEKQMVVVEIEDNGPGIDEKKRTKIFDPFFTTKPRGIGTGLGLFVSNVIIAQNHKGRISVESKTGEGTRFIIELPV